MNCIDNISLHVSFLEVAHDQLSDYEEEDIYIDLLNQVGGGICEHIHNFVVKKYKLYNAEIEWIDRPSYALFYNTIVIINVKFNSSKELNHYKIAHPELYNYLMKCKDNPVFVNPDYKVD